MPEQIEPGPEVARHGVPPSTMILNPLPVELGLSDVAWVRDAARVFEAGGEHRRNELARSEDLSCS